MNAPPRTVWIFRWAPCRPTHALFVLFNLLGAAAGWWACALGAAQGRAWVGPLAVAAYLGIHLAWVQRRGQTLFFLLVAGLLGVLMESGLMLAGLVVYRADWPGWVGLPPVWIAAMWFLFASNLTASLRWLHGRLATAALLGAVFGPLSYLSGNALGAIAFTYDTPTTVGVLAAAWAVILPTLAALAQTLLHVPAAEVRR